MATIHREQTIVNEVINDKDAEEEFKSENLTQLSFDRRKIIRKRGRNDDEEEPEEEGEEEMLRSMSMNNQTKRAPSRLIKLEPIQPSTLP